MKINVKGEYVFNIPIQTMFLNDELKIRNNNIITRLGEVFFLTRMINDKHDPIQYIVLGNASNKPRKSDISLGNLTIKRKCSKNIDEVNKKIILTANFSVNEIYGTSEIGVMNSSVLISHDVYEKLDDNILTPTSGDIEVEYTFNLSTGNFKTGWIIADDSDNLVYYVVEPNNVVMLYEENGFGYKRVNTKLAVRNTPGSYYYDSNLKNLYIRTIDDSNPNNHDIVVQTR